MAENSKAPNPAHLALPVRSLAALAACETADKAVCLLRYGFVGFVGFVPFVDYPLIGC
jgi:hypothetical protein